MIQLLFLILETFKSNIDMLTGFYFSFERQQALLQEHLAKLAQKESESVPPAELGDGTTAFYSERIRGDTEKKKAEMLVSYADVCSQC